MFPNLVESDQFDIPIIGQGEMSDFLASLNEFSANINKVKQIFEKGLKEKPTKIHLSSRSEIDALLRSLEFTELWCSRQLGPVIKNNDQQQKLLLLSLRSDIGKLKIRVHDIYLSPESLTKTKRPNSLP